MNAELVWHCASISVLTQEVDTTAHVARDLSSKAAISVEVSSRITVM